MSRPGVPRQVWRADPQLAEAGQGAESEGSLPEAGRGDTAEDTRYCVDTV